MKESAAVCIAQMGQNKKILRALLDDISSERYEQNFGDGIWSVREHLSHLAAVQPVQIERIKAFLEKEKPEVVPYYPGQETKKTSADIDSLYAEFCRDRDIQLEMVRSADDGVFRKEAVHPGYVKYSFEILLRHLVMHDQFHFYRIEDIGLAKPGLIEKL